MEFAILYLKFNDFRILKIFYSKIIKKQNENYNKMRSNQSIIKTLQAM